MNGLKIIICVVDLQKSISENLTIICVAKDTLESRHAQILSLIIRIIPRKNKLFLIFT